MMIIAVNSDVIFLPPQKTIDSRVPMRNISSLNWFLWVLSSSLLHGNWTHFSQDKGLKYRIDTFFPQRSLPRACFLSVLSVSVCKLLSQPFLHWILPQRHGASERGKRHLNHNTFPLLPNSSPNRVHLPGLPCFIPPSPSHVALSSFCLFSILSLLCGSVVLVPWCWS
jgi:hypothetical protein